MHVLCGAGVAAGYRRAQPQPFGRVLDGDVVGPCSYFSNGRAALRSLYTDVLNELNTVGSYVSSTSHTHRKTSTKYARAEHKQIAAWVDVQLAVVETSSSRIWFSSTNSEKRTDFHHGAAYDVTF